MSDLEELFLDALNSSGRVFGRGYNVPRPQFQALRRAALTPDQISELLTLEYLSVGDLVVLGTLEGFSLEHVHPWTRRWCSVSNFEEPEALKELKASSLLAYTAAQAGHLWYFGEDEHSAWESPFTKVFARVLSGPPSLLEHLALFVELRLAEPPVYSPTECNRLFPSLADLAEAL